MTSFTGLKKERRPDVDAAVYYFDSERGAEWVPSQNRLCK